jgi:hypothetical protein
LPVQKIDLEQRERFTRIVLFFMLAIAFMGLLGITALRIHTSWKNDSHLIHPTGEWIGLANDLKDGIFYRSLFGEYGYGGTRYFPLQFTLLAALLKLDFQPIQAANLLQLIVAIFLMAGLWRLLKVMRIEKQLAACIVVAFLGTMTLHYVILSHRLDLLPLALNLWGLTFCVQSEIRTSHLIAAAIFFTLAFSAKVTSVFGIGAVVLYNLVRGNRKTALKFLAFTLSGFAVAILVIYFASDGRILESMRVGYASDAGSFLKGPFRVLDHLVRRDPIALIFFVLATAALFSSQTLQGFLKLPALLFLTSLAVTTFIHTTSGIEYNHLLELNAASLLVIADWMVAGNPMRRRWGYSILTVTSLIAVAPLIHAYKTEDIIPVRKEYAELVSIVQKSGKKTITEDNLVSIFAGMRPYILNALVFRQLEEKDPSYGEPLWQMMQNREFGAIVLIYDPHENMEWYRSTHFGEEFIRRLEKNYSLFKHVGSQYVFLPK